MATAKQNKQAQASLSIAQSHMLTGVAELQRACTAVLMARSHFGFTSGKAHVELIQLHHELEVLHNKAILGLVHTYAQNRVYGGPVNEDISRMGKGT